MQRCDWCGLGKPIKYIVNRKHLIEIINVFDGSYEGDVEQNLQNKFCSKRCYNIYLYHP